MARSIQHDGKGALRHDGGDRYSVRVYAGRTPTGRKQYLTAAFHAKNDDQAIKTLHTHVTALEKRASVSAERRGTVAEIVDEWLELKRRDRSPSTMKGYERHAAAVLKEFGTMQVQDVTGRHIDAWYKKLAKTKADERDRSANTIAKYHASLRGVLRLAEKYGMVDHVATRRATPPAVTKYEMSPPTSAAVDVLLNAATGWFAVALQILAAGGLRRGELVALRWTDLDGDTLRVSRSVLELKGGRLHTKSTKSGRARELKLDPLTLRDLEAHRNDVERRAEDLGAVLHENACIFPNLQKDPTGRISRRPGWISHAWNDHRVDHGVKARLHDLRHWHATTLIDQGVPIPTVAGRMGHTKVTTTLDIYAHAVAGSDDAAAAVIARTLGTTRVSSLTIGDGK